MDARVGGIHHVTAIAGDAQENVDFYAGLLGMRLVKRSVNQDDPGTYHLFYADAAGNPGSDLTFFPWEHMAKGRLGSGLANEVVLAVLPEALDAWETRLEKEGVPTAREERFGEPTLTFADPHGLRLAIAGTPQAQRRAFEAWKRSPVPGQHQIRGIHSARIVEQDARPTAVFATQALGMRRVGSHDGWDRYEGRDPASGHLEIASRPGAPRGAWGTGMVHHVAWRVQDDAEQHALRSIVRGTGIAPTQVIDRFWFHSVYFREPGGTLFELATDGPGFAVDEDPALLGERLVLPPWLEPRREAIEAALPPIELPHLAGRAEVRA